MCVVYRYICMGICGWILMCQRNRICTEIYVRANIGSKSIWANIADAAKRYSYMSTFLDILGSKMCRMSRYVQI